LLSAQGHVPNPLAVHETHDLDGTNGVRVVRPRTQPEVVSAVLDDVVLGLTLRGQFAVDAHHLQIPVGAACLRIVATGFVTHQTPLCHEETWYRADAYEFRNRIGGLNGTRAALGRFIGSGSREGCSSGVTVSSSISPP